MPVRHPGGNPIRAASGLPAATCECCGPAECRRFVRCVGNTLTDVYICGTLPVGQFSPYVRVHNGECIYVTPSFPLVTPPAGAMVLAVTPPAFLNCSLCTPNPCPSTCYSQFNNGVWQVATGVSVTISGAGTFWCFPQGTGGASQELIGFSPNFSQSFNNSCGGNVIIPTTGTYRTRTYPTFDCNQPPTTSNSTTILERRIAVQVSFNPSTRQGTVVVTERIGLQGGSDQLVYAGSFSGTLTQTVVTPSNTVGFGGSASVTFTNFVTCTPGFSEDDGGI
jgi:hypothetical protein